MKSSKRLLIIHLGLAIGIVITKKPFSNDFRHCYETGRNEWQPKNVLQKLISNRYRDVIVDELSLRKCIFFKKGIFEMAFSCLNSNRSPILKKNIQLTTKYNP